MEADFPRSSLFSSDQRLCSAEILDHCEVRARIKVAVLMFLEVLSSPTPAISRLPLVNRKANNSGLRRGLLSDVSCVFLSHSLCRRSFLRSGQAKAFIRVWKVMAMCFNVLGLGKMVTQRELFYKLLCDSPDYFSSQIEVNRAVQDVVALLRCSRFSLGVMASSKGSIIGRLSIKEPDGDIVDCSVLGPAGYAITGDLSVLNKLEFYSDARYIIVVEKDAIFQRLAEDRLFNQIPCILTTAKGYPDIATRFLLHRLNQAFVELPIYALVDWFAPWIVFHHANLLYICDYLNMQEPGWFIYRMHLQIWEYYYGLRGISIWYFEFFPPQINYCNTCLHFGFSACNVKWLGLHKDDLQMIPQQSFMPLKPRDLQIAKSLMSSVTLQDSYRGQLNSMVEMGNRIDIEALYCHGFDFLGKYIARKIVMCDFL